MAYQMQTQQGFQPAGGFGLQMPQLGFQPMQQQPYQAQPLQIQPIGLGEPLGTMAQPQYDPQAPTTFTIGVPGGFQFVPDASKQLSVAGSPTAAGSREGTQQLLRTRDAGLQKKKSKKKCCLCC